MQCFAFPRVYIVDIRFKKKMRRVVIFCQILLVAAMALCVQSCSSDDEVGTEINKIPAPYGNWLLLGYGSDDDFTGKENIWKNDYFLILDNNGNLEADFGNYLFGTYTFKENGEFTVISCMGSKSLSANPHINFMEDQVRNRNIKSYRVTNDELRLYYSADEYLKFRKQ